MSEARFEILVCRGPTCGTRRHSGAVYDAVCSLVSSYGLEDRIDIGWQSCFGRCTRGPNALVRERIAVAQSPGRLATLPLSRSGRAALYCGLRPEDAGALIHEHVLRGAIVERLLDRPRVGPQTEGRPAQDAAAGGPDSTEKVE